MSSPTQQHRTDKSPLGPPEARRWFFQNSKGESEGPMSFRELRAQAIKQKLTHDMPVWRKGEDTRYPSQEIVGLIPQAHQTAQEETNPLCGVERDHPSPAPHAERTIAQGPPGGLYLPFLRESPFYHILICLGIAGGLGYFATTLIDTQQQSIIYTFAGLAVLAWIFFSLIYLKRAWDMMHMLGASMTGLKAVFVFVIPFFNAVWSFVALYGWAKLWNSNGKNHPGLAEAKPVSVFAILLFCIGFLMSQIMILKLWTAGEFPTVLTNPSHQFVLGTMAATFCLSLLTWYQICRSINFLARKKS